MPSGPPGTTSASRAPFVAVGGLGGSGTRLIAALLAEFGISIGHDLNESLDNLSYTLLFKRHDLLALDAVEIDRDLELFTAANTGARRLGPADHERLRELVRMPRNGHGEEWLRARAEALAEPPPRLPSSQRWGWKEPNTHVLLPALMRNFPEMRYIHVVRHGLDMAFSSNQNQLRYWADSLVGQPMASGPAQSLAYWCAVQKRARQCGSEMGGRFLWLNYDQFCLLPEQGLERLRRFLDAPGPVSDDMRQLVRPPASMGRYRSADCTMFSRRDIEAVAEMGFSVD